MTVARRYESGAVSPSRQVHDHLDEPGEAATAGGDAVAESSLLIRWYMLGARLGDEPGDRRVAQHLPDRSSSEPRRDMLLGGRRVRRTAQRWRASRCPSGWRKAEGSEVAVEERQAARRRLARRGGEVISKRSPGARLQPLEEGRLCSTSRDPDVDTGSNRGARRTPGSSQVERDQVELGLGGRAETARKVVEHLGHGVPGETPVSSGNRRARRADRPPSSSFFSSSTRWPRQ